MANAAAQGDGLRVLHVLEAIEGGTSRYLTDLVVHARRIDHHVAIPSTRRGGGTDLLLHQSLLEAEATLHIVEMARAPARPVNAQAVVALRRLMRQLRPSVVHAHSAVGGALGRLAALGSGTPVVYTPQGIALGRASRSIERLLGHATTRLVAVSASEAELARHLRLVPPEHIVTIYNGIDVEAPEPGPNLRDRLGVPRDTPIVGTIARLVPQKAPEIFVAACAHIARRVPRAHFVLIGSGALQPLLDEEIARHDIAKRFHQIKVEPNAARLLAQLDVFALSSRFEGAPYAPMEAMRAATPVVLTDVVGSRETIEQGTSGLLVPPEDPVALGDAVASLLLDPDLARRLGRSGRERVHAIFDVRAMGEAHRSLYGAVRGDTRHNVS